MKKIIVLLALLSLLLAGCGSDDKPLTADYDITGTWEYTLHQDDMEDTTYDNGTITFSGVPTEGTYTLINFYDIEESGTYLVDRLVFGINGGDEFRVKGSFTDADHLLGTWESGDSRKLGVGGLFTATRK